MSLSCFFDVETTGLPTRAGYDTYYHYSNSLAYDSSRVVSIAMMFVNEDNETVEEFDVIIRPVGFEIPKSDYHEITQEMAMESGVLISDFFASIEPFLRQTTIVIGHNVSFDTHVTAAELFRQGCLEYAFWLSTIKTHDTMKMAAELGLPKALKNLYRELFHQEMPNHHNAMADVLHCYEIYQKLSGDYIATCKCENVPNK